MDSSVSFRRVHIVVLRTAHCIVLVVTKQFFSKEFMAHCLPFFCMHALLRFERKFLQEVALAATPLWNGGHGTILGQLKYAPPHPPALFRA